MELNNTYVNNQNNFTFNTTIANTTTTNAINNTNEPEQPETLEQKRDNVIGKLNNLEDLKTYLQKKKVKLSELNDEDFDILIYAIEHTNSVSLINFIIKETPYDNLNYSFFDSGKYKSFFVSVIDRRISYKGYKIPLFSAIASNKFRMADALIKKYNANINYHINGGEYKNVDILNYLYYMSGFRDYLNPKNLKYILHNGFNIQHITPDLMNKMVNRNYSDGLLEILLKYYIYDNDFIISLLSIYNYQYPLTNTEIQNIFSNEKRKITIDEDFYDNADEHENYDAIYIYLILDNDGRDPEELYDIIENYALLERAVEYNHVELVRKIISYYSSDLARLPLENALMEASKNINLDMLTLLLDTVFQSESSVFVDLNINFEKVLAESSRYHHIHYMEEAKQKHIEIMKSLIEAILKVSLSCNCFGMAYIRLLVRHHLEPLIP